MQFVSRSTRTVHDINFMSALASVPARIAGWMDRRRRVAIAIRELAWHSDRELADMGVSRGDIVALAEGRSRE